MGLTTYDSVCSYVRHILLSTTGHQLFLFLHSSTCSEMLNQRMAIHSYHRHLLLSQQAGATIEELGVLSWCVSSANHLVRSQSFSQHQNVLLVWAGRKTSKSEATSPIIPALAILNHNWTHVKQSSGSFYMGYNPTSDYFFRLDYDHNRLHSILGHMTPAGSTENLPPGPKLTQHFLFLLTCKSPGNNHSKSNVRFI